jgi:hypothetical protein
VTSGSGDFRVLYRARNYVKQDVITRFLKNIIVIWAMGTIEMHLLEETSDCVVLDFKMWQKLWILDPGKIITLPSTSSQPANSLCFIFIN